MMVREDMDKILDCILYEHNILLESYEEMYQNFKSTVCENADEYISIMNKNIEFIEPISSTQKRIEELRTQLKVSIRSDVLIDNVLDEYSCGRLSDITSRIESIIKSINEYEENGITVLEEEMERIACGLEDMGILKF